MTVLQAGKFYPPHPGGMETALRDICEVIGGSVKLEVVVANDRRGNIEERHGKFRVRRMGNWGTLFSQPVTPGLVAEFRRTDADLVHLHEPNPLAMVSFLVSGCRARLVIHYHSDIVRQKRLAGLYRPWLRRGLERADAVIVGSRELMESSRHLARWREKCEVIPFGIDLAPFLEVRRDRTGSAGGAPLILAVGRLSYYKGFQHLVSAMGRVDGRLVIIGEGETRRQLERQIRRLGLSGRVKLAGQLTEEEKLAWYERADLFCLPSCERSEAFGLVMVEAMAAGLPVVSTDLPTGVRSVNANGESGLVVPPGDEAALSEALALLAGDPGLRGRMGVAARRRAREKFSRERMGGQILELYERVLAGARGRASATPARTG